MGFHVRSRRTVFSALATAAVGFTLAGAAQASVVYNNFKGTYTQSEENQGATSADLTTNLLADDITPIAGAEGQDITSFGVELTNSNLAPDNVFDVDLHFRFYDATGPNDGPGNLIGTWDFDQFGLVSNHEYSYIPFAFGAGAAPFVVPTTNDGKFWAGIFYTGASEMTAAQLNNIGLGINNPPTVGSSADEFFESSGSPDTFTSNDPTGDLLSSGGGQNPAVNFGWTFSTAAISNVAVAPESNSAILLGLGLAAVGGLLIARRRASA